MSFLKHPPGHLERWHKVEDSTGVTQFWPVVTTTTVQRPSKIRQMTIKQPVVPLSTSYPATSRNQPTFPIWSAASNHTRPAVSVKKPRARRLLRNLLCCFRTKPAEPPAPLSPTIAVDHYSPKTSEKLLLPPVRQCDYNKKCLIIDLDETLVHSSFKPVKNPDFIIPVEIDGVIHQVYVLKRPYVDEFLQRIGNLYECVLFTASLAKYADPVADLLDRWGVFRTRLFREACVYHKGNYVKDLNRLGRDLKRVVIMDNSPASYAFHPENAIPVQSWFDDTNDAELIQILPFMEKLSRVENVYPVLRTWNATRSSTMRHNPAPIANSENTNFVVDRMHTHIR